MTNPRIYVACTLSHLGGDRETRRWLDATQGPDVMQAEIQEMLDNSYFAGAKEYGIYYYEGFGKVRISEGEDLQTVANYAEFITEHGELGEVLLYEYGYEEALRMIYECYQGAYESELDFAYHVFDEYYSYAIPSNLIAYIDHEAFARDLFMDGYCSVEAGRKTHVFLVN